MSFVLLIIITCCFNYNYYALEKNCWFVYALICRQCFWFFFIFCFWYFFVFWFFFDTKLFFYFKIIIEFALSALDFYGLLDIQNQSHASYTYVCISMYVHTYTHSYICVYTDNRIYICILHRSHSAYVQD